MPLACLSADAINVRRSHQLKQPATPPGPVPETAPPGWAAVLKFSLLLERFRLARLGVVKKTGTPTAHRGGAARGRITQKSALVYLFFCP